MDAGSGKDTLSFPEPGGGIDHLVLKGGDGSTLAFGPGHRNIHFTFLKRLRAHGEIVLHTTTGTLVRYRVREPCIVDSRAGGGRCA